MKILTVNEAIGQLAALEAVDLLVEARRAELRAVLQDRADAYEATEGVAANFKLTGVGQAYVTQPKATGVIDDRAAFEKWALANVEAEHRRVVDYGRLNEALDQDPALVDDLCELGVVRTELFLPEGLLDELIARMPHNDAGLIFDPSTGETFGLRRVPGSKGKLTVKIEKAAKEQRVAAIRGAMPPLLRGSMQ